MVEHLHNWRQALREFRRVARNVVLTTPSIYGMPVLEVLAALRLVNVAHIRDHKHYLRRHEIEAEGYRHQYFLFGLNQVAVYEEPVAETVSGNGAEVATPS